MAELKRHGENAKGFHHPPQQNYPRQPGGSEGPMGSHSSERGEGPTNHSGHTYEHARRAEADARIERVRAAHGAGSHERDYHGGHERILHETHALHQHEDHGPSQSKYGAAHHFREEHGDTPAHERRESKAEREREGE
jgi:hypothetical protein